MSRWALIQSSNSFLKNILFICFDYTGLHCCAWAISRCDFWASCRRGFSRCRAQALGCMGFGSCGAGVYLPRGTWRSLQPRDGTCVHCLGRKILFFFFFLVKENLFLIGGELLYNVVLISAIHPHEYATGTHTHVSSHLPPHPTLLGCHRAPL